MTRTITPTMTTIMLALCNFVIASPLSATPAVYDQRQTGDLNVQVNLKNVHVVTLLNSEILEDYTDYDYFYDYADFTVKPSNKPTSSSTEKNDVTQMVEPAFLQNSTASGSPVNSTNSIDEVTPDIDPSNGTVNSTLNIDYENQSSGENRPVSVDIRVSSILASSTAPITLKPVQTLRSKKRCKSGYIPIGNGRCRRTNRRWLSLP
ncbi:uncharacterized protein LOC105185333 [Harpegnathos saltator]|uniref:Uncharacterized protein n=1 Tax=Harpegnathos saltator TaxID=610380 RepID=E2BQ43_HARSA|nr:uncharacterized protein LOC105185333 [Harpegnathos saltator]EFN82231.1 hypothetical protein EAI_05180 [Harpegnathos saltator]